LLVAQLLLVSCEATGVVQVDESLMAESVKVSEATTERATEFLKEVGGHADPIQLTKAAGTMTVQLSEKRFQEKVAATASEMVDEILNLMSRSEKLKVKVKAASIYESVVRPSLLKDLKNYLANLPKETLPGSQKRLQEKFLGAKNKEFEDSVATEVNDALKAVNVKDQREEVKRIVAKGKGAGELAKWKDIMERLELEFKKLDVDISPSQFSPPMMASYFADNLEECPSLKKGCENLLVQQQCPATCEIETKRVKKMDEVIEAKNRLASAFEGYTSELLMKQKEVEIQILNENEKQSLMKENLEKFRLVKVPK